MMRQLMSKMSEPKFGEDESDYFKRQMVELAGFLLANQIELARLREACRLRYKQLEVTHLLEKMQTEESPAAIKRAITLLLKEVFAL